MPRQAEIDKVLKKVLEGVEVFEGILEKIQLTGNYTQKEKMEADLKKEIKKLQKSRDQIKIWISSNDIKDKRALIENRKLIELQMERFKACEKELKTKAFSKEGLSAAVKIDPLQKEKDELSEWIQKVIDSLNTQVDAFEAEAETLQGQKKRGKDTSKAERLAEIEESVIRHKHHVNRLEIVNRLMNNGNLSIEDVKGIKDSVNYYVESNQEPGFEEDEYIYDELNLDDAEIFGFNNENSNEDRDSEVENSDEDVDYAIPEDFKKKSEEISIVTSPSKQPKATPPRTSIAVKEE
ncbi:CCR4-NOT transcription complex, subunit 3, partial [Dinochytrium kinnereticum]